MDSIAEMLTGESLLAATAMFGAFIGFLFVGSRLVPGRQLRGVELRDGSSIVYSLNGLRLLALTGVALGALQVLGLFSLSAVVTHFWALFVVANLFAFGMTGLLYVLGRRNGASVQPGLLGGIKDAFYGVELNPTWWRVDLKMFSYRPSLIGLAVLNVSFAALQYQRYGMLSDAMVLYQLFTLVYVINYFEFEYGMVFTWDIIAERFGWMLVWGDFVLVPFFYSISGWFLVDRVEPLPWWLKVGLVVLFGFGFWLFRGANQQKHAFKMDPETKIWGRPAEALGGRLLVSGFWGIGRHLNYSGEICVYLAWTFTTGLGSPVPYLLPLWLASLLLHRAWRDDRRCSAKYGDLWRSYTQKARFRMVPLLY